MQMNERAMKPDDPLKPVMELAIGKADQEAVIEAALEAQKSLIDAYHTSRRSLDLLNALLAVVLDKEEHQRFQQECRKRGLFL